MDTRLKKFNSTFILKVIAFMLCLSCAINCMSQAIGTIDKIDDGKIRDCSYEDAFYKIFTPDRDITHTQTFKFHVGQYSHALASMIGRFGDGSEKSYKQWKNSISASNDAFYKKARENLINHIIADEFRLYLSLVDAGIAVPLGMLSVAEFSGNSLEMDETSIDVDDLDFNWLCNSATGNVVKYTNDAELKKKAEELGADGVFELNNFYQVLSEDYDYDSAEVIVKESYKPGCYAFKIDDEAFKDRLIKENLFVSDDYGSAEQFKSSYNMYADTVKEEYPSGKYFIRDASGSVYTNVKGLGKSSTNEDAEKKFASLGFYCMEREYGDIYLPDGKYYTQGGFDGAPYSGRVYEHDYEVTARIIETTVVPGAEKVTEPVPSQEVLTTAYVNAYDSTPFINEDNGNWYCLLGVDMNARDYAETDLFRTTVQQIEYAKEIITDAACTAGILGTLFLVCFIYLVVRAGRRSGDSEVYLMKTDAMFTDWRIILDVFLGWCVCGLFFFTCDEFYDYDNNVFKVLSSLLAMVFTALVLDLVLFITRHIKARTLLKNLFPVWLIRKIFAVYKNKIKPVSDEKLLYTKHFSKGTIIRIVAVIGINFVLGFLGVIEVVNTETLSFFCLLALFDIVAFIWFIRLIGGLHKIFSALEEIRGGNYSVHINLSALPGILRESADKVMSLRDGLKTAVDEAVKQTETKTELITNVSHDLKTPLTSIINYVELLKKCNITDADAKEYLDILGEKSDRLKKLIEDLVEASKASTGNIKVELVEVSMNEMVSQLLGEHADSLEKRKLNVVAEFSQENLTVKADGKLLYRVMENLIVNVEKYSLSGTRVYVTVKREGNYGTVTFKNISEQPLNITADQLKERFVRGDASRSTEGNGLGLSIAQSLCDVQGGQLEITINGDLFTAKVKLKN